MFHLGDSHLIFCSHHLPINLYSSFSLHLFPFDSVSIFLFNLVCENRSILFLCALSELFVVACACVMEAHHHQHHISVNVDTDRFPQWSIQETKQFLMIRAELDRTFMETKRNKLLWDVISNKLKEKGFHRSADQCKCKWKNLVTRYKVLIETYK